MVKLAIEALSRVSSRTRLARKLLAAQASWTPCLGRSRGAADARAARQRGRYRDAVLAACLAVGLAGCEDRELQVDTTLRCDAELTACPAFAGTASEAVCVDVQSDAAHCGCCGNACGRGTECHAGRCDAAGPFAFFVFGDTHTKPIENDVIASGMEQMRALDPNAIAAFSNGDLTNSGSTAEWSQHDALIATYGFSPHRSCPASFGATPRYFGSLGDHDELLGDWETGWNAHLSGSPQLDWAAAGGVNYSLTYANALFVVLDSQLAASASAETRDAQTKWLESILSASEAQLKFVFFHQPIYPCNARHEPLAAGLPWVGLSEKHGVNVVFNSHTHVYSRSCAKRNGNCTNDGTGITFVETGPLGGDPREIDVREATVSGTDDTGAARLDRYDCIVGQGLVAAADSQNDFCHVSVDGCKATIACYVVGENHATPFDTWTVSVCE